MEDTNDYSPKVTTFVKNARSEQTASYMESAIDLHCTVYNFPSHASVVVTRKDGKLQSIKVQAFDAYSYQRELFIGARRTPGTKTWKWMSSAYQHPFRPSVEAEVSYDVANRFMERFIELCEKYPTLLFHGDGYGKGYARNHGFVVLHDRLLHGAIPTVRLFN